MKLINILLALVLFSCVDLSPSLEKKIDKAILKEFRLEGIEKRSIDAGAFSESRPGHRLLLYSLHHDGNRLGYFIVSSAMGRYELFDYGVLYDERRTIRKVIILTYRSDHGYEIAGKKWLAQFEGGNGCGLIYGEDIDALSGATYSAASLTADLDLLCEALTVLEESGGVD